MAPLPRSRASPPQDGFEEQHQPWMRILNKFPLGVTTKKRRSILTRSEKGTSRIIAINESTITTIKVHYEIQLLCLERNN